MTVMFPTGATASDQVTELDSAAIPGIPIPSRADAELADRLTGPWLLSFDSPHTRDAYTRDLSQWQVWCKAAQVTPLTARRAHMDAWIERQRENGVTKRTIARRVAAVSSWYGFLKEETADLDSPLAAYNPAHTRRRPKVDKDASPTVGLTPGEARDLVAAADEDGLRSSALVRLLLSCGLRVGSVAAADIENMGYDEGHRVLTLRGKGDKIRKVALPVSVAKALDAMLAARGSPSEGPLFATRTGRRVYRTYPFKLIRRLANAAGIPAADLLSPHSMRHTFATTALRKGTPLHVLQDAMWHADARTTKAYDRARERLDDSPAYVVAGEFEPIGVTPPA